MTAKAIADSMSVRPWLAVNPWSRLARFISAPAMDWCCEKPDLLRDERLLDVYFRPYARDLSAATTDILGRRRGQALIVDVHSFPLEPLPYELHKDEHRPEVCLGADDFHSPKDLVDAVRNALAGSFTTAVNEPFHGCYIPDRYYGVDPRVHGLMVELRRDVGDAAERLELLARALGPTLDAVTGF